MNNLLLCFAIAAVGLLSCGGPSSATSSGEEMPQQEPRMSTQSIVWTGATDESAAVGIRSFAFDHQTGELTLLAEEKHLPVVSFFDISPDGKVLYAVYSGGEGGKLGTFAIGSEGKLTWVGEQNGGEQGPCYISITADGSSALIANYSGGSIQIFPIQEGQAQASSQKVQHEGSSVNAGRQESAHPHMINSTPNGTYVFVPDLGTDQMMSYEWKDGQLAPAAVPFVRFFPGSGPRHFDIHKDLKIAYVLDELYSRVTSVKLAEDYGLVDTMATYPLLPDGFTDFNKSSDIHLTPDGKFLYAANRGHNSLTIFKVESTGALTRVGHESTRGEWPRNFAISPDGQFLIAANRKSDNLLVFRIDSATGKLALLHEYHGFPGVQCIKFQTV